MLVDGNQIDRASQVVQGNDRREHSPVALPTEVVGFQNPEQRYNHGGVIGQTVDQAAEKLVFDQGRTVRLHLGLHAASGHPGYRDNVSRPTPWG
jgi:hypothetical protein